MVPSGGMAHQPLPGITGSLVGMDLRGSHFGSAACANSSRAPLRESSIRGSMRVFWLRQVDHIILSLLHEKAGGASMSQPPKIILGVKLHRRRRKSVDRKLKPLPRPIIARIRRWTVD
jgi:hypothetical protein